MEITMYAQYFRLATSELDNFPASLFSFVSLHCSLTTMNGSLNWLKNHLNLPPHACRHGGSGDADQSTLMQTGFVNEPYPAQGACDQIEIEKIT